MLEVVHNHQAECDPVQVNINIFVACFTTCWARLKLYEGIKQLEPDQIQYFDADSFWRPGLPDLPLGNYLGEFTNELDDGDYIVEFASGGPKNYGFRTLKWESRMQSSGVQPQFPRTRTIKLQHFAG